MNAIIMPPGEWEGRGKPRPVKQSVKYLSVGLPMSVIDFQPGNGTRYILSLIDVKKREPEAREAMGMYLDTEYMIVLHNMGSKKPAYVGSRTQWYDITEKLDIDIADALPLTYLIRHLCGQKVF